MHRVDAAVCSVAGIADRLTASGVDPVVMRGAMGEKARAAAVVELVAEVEAEDRSSSWRPGR